MEPNDRDEYERRLREKSPEPLWWESLRENQWLVVVLVIAVVAMVVVGFAVT
jgi:hypothetical protein